MSQDGMIPARPSQSWVVPAALAAGLVAVTLTSEVRFSLVPVGVAHLLMVAYACLLMWAAVLPLHPRWHMVGVGLAVATFGLRLAGFAEIAATGRVDLVGAVFERLGLMAAAVMWHVRSLHWWEWDDGV